MEMASVVPVRIVAVLLLVIGVLIFSFVLYQSYVDGAFCGGKGYGVTEAPDLRCQKVVDVCLLYKARFFRERAMCNHKTWLY